MIHDEKKVLAELNARRDEYFKLRRKRLGTAACALAAALAIGAAAVMATVSGGNAPSGAEANASPAPTVSVDPARVPHGDPWYGEMKISDGWYNDPVEGGVSRMPDTVCVRMNTSAGEVIYNMTDKEGVETLLGLVARLEKTGSEPDIEPAQKPEFVVILSKARRVFRLSKYPDGLYRVNDLGSFRMKDEASRDLTRFMEACADKALNNSDSRMMSFGGEPVIACFTFPND